MLYLRERVTDDVGNKTESYVTDPVQVDRVAREAWNPIYAGNVKDKKQHSRSFVDKYGKASGLSVLYEPDQPASVVG